MKPKPLSKGREEFLKAIVAQKAEPDMFSVFDARAILAALEYERKRAEEALDFIASQAKSFAGLPRGKEMDAFLAKHGRQKTEVTPPLLR